MITRISEKRLAKLGGKYPSSTIAAPRKPVKKVNIEASKKRRARNAKRMRGKEYQEARKGAMERSGGKCEFIAGYTWDWAEVRCGETNRLQFHEEHYARGRILTADDGKIYCPLHHRYVESLKPHKQHRRGF